MFLAPGLTLAPHRDESERTEDHGTIRPRFRDHQDGRGDRLLPRRLRSRAGEARRRARATDRDRRRRRERVMRVRILGSAAGGGFPQWNCGCPNCTLARRASSDVQARTQDSVLVSTDDAKAAYLLNASPDVATQIATTRELHPRGLRHTPIMAVVLTNADLDHCVGLLSLRESQPFT